MICNSIVLFSNKPSNRLNYVAELIFGDLMGLTIIFEYDKNNYLDSPLPKINYTQTPHPKTSGSAISKNELFIKNQTLLFENAIFTPNWVEDLSYLAQKKALDFDFLAATFLLVTRYEEYDAISLDSHNRYSAKSSIAHTYGFLRQPLINQWAAEVREHLEKLFPELETTVTAYQFQPTFDIDMPWKYKHKGALRTIGGFAKDAAHGKASELKNRLNILRGVKNDPDFTFDYIFDLHKTTENQPIFFLLLGNFSEFDKNPNVKNKAFQSFIQSVATRYTVGLHPSYRSNEGLTILEKEKMRFETMTAQTLVRSRQHFLKLRFPETYQRLLSIGIKHDYSMGYADDIGFRASIATPFRWFDLSKNEVTDLWIHPFQVMEVTLRDYLNLTPNEAIEQVKQLIDATHAVGGTFVTLWHNSSFSNTEGWQGWREVYEQIILHAKK
jgi:hypothetical protein